MRNKTKKGFTLTELLIVIAILAILATIAIPVVSGLLKKGTDTTEDVNTAYYTSVMQRFASEDVGAAALYPRLTAQGINSEYQTFSQKAGKGTFPGYNIIASTMGSDVTDQIRREAVIALKAFGDTAVKDNYYISPPADGDYEYVYYYLTGQVKKEKRSDMVEASASDYLNGVINVDEYWVYLSRDGGSGAALGGVANGKGYMFVQVLQYGIGTPLDGATVTLQSGAKTFTAKTSAEQNGFVGFSDVPEGSAQISVSYPGGVSFPDSRYYAKSGEVIISPDGYEGCQLNSPYVVELMVGSLGSLGFYNETVRWENGDWVESRSKITSSVSVSSAFTPDASRAIGSERSESYLTNLSMTGGIQNLLDNGRFLAYGHYRLAVSAYGYRTLNMNVEAKVYGIDDDSHAFSGYSSPYEYPVIMKYPSGQSKISGTIKWESLSQPLYGTGTGLSGSWAYTANASVNSRVKLTNIRTGVSYQSAILTQTSSGKSYYEITGLPDGEYTFIISSPYGYTTPEDFPDKVTIDGRHVEISGSVYRKDVSTGTLEGTITYDYRGNYDPVPGARGTLKRNGSSSTVATFVTDKDGNFAVSGNLDRGFYNLSVAIPSGLGGGTYFYKFFIAGNEDVVLRVGISTFTLLGTLKPIESDFETPITKAGTLAGTTVQYTRVSADGKTRYSKVSASLNTSGVSAIYSVVLLPGYYIVHVEGPCYGSMSTIVLNIKQNNNPLYEIFVDDWKGDHAKITNQKNAKGHWAECENCGHIFDFEAHSESGWTYKSTASCYKYCTVCSYVTTPASAHTLSSYVSKAATCTADGNRVYYCTKGCGYSYNEKIDKSGHKGNGVWVYDNNGTASSYGTHHQNCSNCGTAMNTNTACSRGGYTSNGASTHYDKCSVCNGRRYFDHAWVETSRNGYICTGGTIYYKCSGCGETKTGNYAATAEHNIKGMCDTFHSCKWETYCTSGDVHVWNGRYHIMCSICGQQSSSSSWCAIHCGNSMPKFPCPD